MACSTLLRDKSEDDVQERCSRKWRKTPPAAGLGASRKSSTSTIPGWTKPRSKRAERKRSRGLDDDRRAKTRPTSSRLMGRLRLLRRRSASTSSPTRPTRPVRRQHHAGRPRHAGARLLPDQRREVRRYRAAYKPTSTQHLRTDRRQGAGRAAADGDRARDQARRPSTGRPRQQRDVQATNNPVDRAGLKKIDPGDRLDMSLDAGGLGDVQHFVVQRDDGARDGARLLDTQPVATWKEYLVSPRRRLRGATCPRRSTTPTSTSTARP